MYLFLSLCLAVSSVSGNFVTDIIPQIVSVSDNSVSDNTVPDIIAPAPEDEHVNEEVNKDDEIRDDIIPEISDKAVDVEIPTLSDIEKIIMENKEPAEILVTVSDNSISVSDNSVSANDILPINESLSMMSKALAFMAANIEPTLSAVQVSEYYVNYFRGVLQNMPFTHYLAYAERVRVGTTNQYVTHYYLFYDLEFDDQGQVIRRVYPCIDIWSESNVYYAENTDKLFEGYPTFGYASFEPYSALVDRSFHFNDLYVGLISVFVLFVIGRKTLFS